MVRKAGSLRRNEMLLQSPRALIAWLYSSANQHTRGMWRQTLMRFDWLISLSSQSVRWHMTSFRSNPSPLLYIRWPFGLSAIHIIFNVKNSKTYKNIWCWIVRKSKKLHQTATNHSNFTEIIWKINFVFHSVNIIASFASFVNATDPRNRNRT